MTAGWAGNSGPRNTRRNACWPPPWAGAEFEMHRHNQRWDGTRSNQLRHSVLDCGGVLSLFPTSFASPAAESQRDSVVKPRVARHELPWVCLFNGLIEHEHK